MRLVGAGLWYRGVMGNGSRRWRRLVVRAVVCAGVGAVVTVGVAWLRASTLDLDARLYSDAWQEPGEPGPWGARADRVYLWGLDTGAGIRRWMVTSLRDHGAFDFWELTLVETGWPCLSMRSRCRVLVVDDVVRELTSDGLVIGSDAPPSPDVLPVRPLVRGFVVDTGCYGLVAFALWSAPGVIRGRVRRTRGRCVGCGYDLRGAGGAVCPECGA